MSLVVDAGVALKWFLAIEPDAGPAPSIVRDEAVLTAPDLLIVTLLRGWRG